MYELSGFDVTRSNSHFKLCDSVVSIRLNEFTKMVEVAAVANPIPTEMFRFRTLEELMALANTNVHLPGVSSSLLRSLEVYLCNHTSYTVLSSLLQTSLVRFLISGQRTMITLRQLSE